MTGTAQISVLVIEDTPEIAELVSRSLERDGMTVEIASNLADARARLQVTKPDVVVLDVELPDGSGLDLLRNRVAVGDTPVVVLSGRDNEIDRVQGLELGADDYVVKPFFSKELAARVRLAAGRPRVAQQPARLDVGDLSVDLNAREVRLRGSLIELTDREFDLLAYLAGSARRVVGRDELLRHVWRTSPEWQSAKTIHEHVRRVRTKIEDDPHQPRRLVTVGRSGYRLEP